MIPFRQEVQELISACAGLHALFVDGGRLTPDEQDVVEFFASDLLSRVKQTPAGLLIPATPPAPPPVMASMPESGSGSEAAAAEL